MKMGVRLCLVVLLCGATFCSGSSPEDDRLVSLVAERLQRDSASGRSHSEPLLVDRNSKDTNVYEVNINFKVKCDGSPCDTDSVKCHAYIKDSEESLEIVNDEVVCENIPNVENSDSSSNSDESSPITETIQLAHELKLNDQYAGSGEQFIAIRRDSIPGGNWCADCPTDVSVNAEGVQELANAALENLNRHKPNSKHILRRIVRVQRQAQIVNGIRYILLLEVDTTACETIPDLNREKLENEVTNTCWCQVTFLEKPWLKLANGMKFRTILSNNCTNEYIYGNEGEALSPNDNDKFKDAVKAVIDTGLQAELPNKNKELTEEQIKNIQSQIITNIREFERSGSSGKPVATNDAEIIVRKQEGDQAVAQETYDITPSYQTDAPEPEDKKTEVSSLSDDKKEALNGFLDFFSFNQFPSSEDKQEPITENVESQKSMTTKRSASSDALSKESFMSPSIYLLYATIENSSEDQKEEIDELSPVVTRVRRNAINLYENLSQPEKDMVKRLAKLGVETLDEFDSDELKRLVLQILSSTKLKKGQITNYFIKAKVGTSKCLESVQNDDECYSSVESGKTSICNIQVEVKSNGNTKVLKSNCVKEDETLKRNKRSNEKPKERLVGAPASVDVSDTKIQQLSHKSLSHFDLNSSHDHRHKVLEVVSATRQVVAGLKYDINFKAIATDCLKTDKRSLEYCSPLEGHSEKTCISSIWERPWLNSTQITVNCETPNDRPKRSTESEQIENLQELILTQKLFDMFLKKYKRTYMHDREEYRKRFEIFRKNLDFIDELNENELGTAKYGPNMFADVSPEEFQSKYLGLRPDLKHENLIPFADAVIPDIDDLPDSFDWRDKGAVTPVKNQGSCGSCWAFSVTGNIEGQYEIKYGKLLSLSEQELVDCDKLDDGCGGGLPDNAYRAIEELGGLELETDYPYDAADEKCHFNKTLARVQISSAVNISTNEIDMQKWLVKNGPISIGINANAMQFYMGGVSHPFKFLCSPNNLDHGVLIVGYGIHTYPLFNKTMPYWIIKNSWGDSWGERGYYRVYRGDGTCGLNLMASSAII